MISEELISFASLPSYHPYQVLATCGVISEELISFASLPSYHPYQVLATCGVISEELISFASWARMWRFEGWHVT